MILLTRVCWNCDSVDSMFSKEGDYEITVRDKTYIIHGKKSTCMKCGASDIDELYDLMIKEARNLYMKEMGILFGELTQTNYIDEMIRKCFNTSSALEILESNKTKISDDEYKAIKDKIICSNYQ